MASVIPPHSDGSLSERIIQEITNIKVILGSLMSRAEIEAADAKRVLNESYQADMRAMNERMLRQESAPTRLIAWLGAIFGAVGCLATAASVLIAAGGLAFTIIWTLAPHH